MADDKSWFSDDPAPMKRAPPPLQRGSVVELAIEVERELGLAEGAAVVWRKALYRLTGGQWIEVHDADLSRRVQAYDGRATPSGLLYLSHTKVREAVVMLKMRWPSVRELPATKEAPHGS